MNKVMSLRVQRVAQLGMYGNGFEPFLPAYLIAHHFQPGEILLLLAIRQLLAFPLQVPTGIFADKVSRTLSLTIGASAAALGMSIYAVATTWPWILVASIVGGIGKNFFAGADGALARAMHHQLYPGDWKLRFELFVARITRYQGLVEAATVLAAAVLASTLGLEAVIIAQAITYAAVLVLVLVLKEPDRLTGEQEEPKEAHLDPSDFALDVLTKIRPHLAWAFVMSRMDPTFVPHPSVAKEVAEIGIGTVHADGRVSLPPAYQAPIAIQPVERRPPTTRRRSFYVVQLPPTANAIVYKVRSEHRPGELLKHPSYRILEPADHAAKWPTHNSRPLVGGAYVPTKGPARHLKDKEYVELVASIERREQRRRFKSLVALIAAAGAMAALTAATYRLAPLYFASIRYEGRSLPPAGFGWVWTAYLASLWVLGLGYKWLGKLRFTKALGALGGLALLGGVCYVVFGLVATVWGLFALMGLALVRAHETPLLTKFLNDLSSTRRQAAVLSVLRMTQDSLAAGALLLVGWMTRSGSLQMGLIWAGSILTLIICLALGVLAYFYTR